MRKRSNRVALKSIHTRAQVFEGMNGSEMPELVQELFDGPLDLVGDIHGEIVALRSLLARLGYDEEGRHSEGRRLIFLGDIVDRGPNSPQVVSLVKQLVESGVAQCVLGNHESNLIEGVRKAGNHWFFGEEERSGGKESPFFPSVLLHDPSERELMVAFFRSLPLALERDDLRVVHACWDETSIRKARGSTREELIADEEVCAGDEEGQRRIATLGEKLLDESVRPEFDPILASYAASRQMRSALRVLTAGPEAVKKSGCPSFSGGKWRFVERVDWWDDYEGIPVVIGHYWRTRLPRLPKKSGAVPHVPPNEWWGRGKVYCVDYSVGMRFVERQRGQTEEFSVFLGALRWPESRVVFDGAKLLSATDSRRDASSGV